MELGLAGAAEEHGAFGVFHAILPIVVSRPNLRGRSETDGLSLPPQRLLNALAAV